MTDSPVTPIDRKAALAAEEQAITDAVSENVSILLHRSRMSATALAREVGLSKATMNRKMLVGPWHYVDLARIAAFYSLTVTEVAEALPSARECLDRWKAATAGYAIRDSNPEPADSVCRVLPFPLVSVKGTLTLDRRAAVAG